MYIAIQHCQRVRLLECENTIEILFNLMFQYHEKVKNDAPRITGRVSDTGGRV